jgi:hypothetical protein
MSSSTYTNFATTAGERIARGWRAYVRGEKRMRAHFLAQGVSHGRVTLGVWGVRAALLSAAVYCLYLAIPVLKIVLYYTMSTVIVIGIVAALVYVLANASGDTDIKVAPPRKDPEMRGGHAGTGLYNEYDERIDDHDPNDIRDTGF